MMTDRRCRHLLSVVVALALGIAGGIAQAGTVTALPGPASPIRISIPTQEWADVIDPPSRISVKLPGKAEVEKSSKGREYSATSGNYYFGFTVIDNSVSPSDLDRALQAVAEGAGGTLTSSQKTTVNGHPAVDGRLMHTGEDTPLVTFLRYIAAGTHVVQLQTTGPAADENAAMQLHQQLLASLRIP